MTPFFSARKPPRGRRSDTTRPHSVAPHLGRTYGGCLRIISFFLCVGSLFLLSPEQAHALNGNDLLEWCADTDEGESKDNIGLFYACVSYVAAVSDAERTYTHWGQKLPLFCILPDVSLQQMRKVLLRYLNAHPERWHESASSLAINSFVETWPCGSAEYDNEVARAQSCLAFLGYHWGAIDGRRSAVTKAAARRWIVDNPSAKALDVCKEKGWAWPRWERDEFSALLRNALAPCLVKLGFYKYETDELGVVRQEVFHKAIEAARLAYPSDSNNPDKTWRDACI